MNARTLDQASLPERQRIFGLLDRCRLTVTDNPPVGMGVVYVTFCPWKSHGKRWAYMGRSGGWCLRYLGSGKIIKALRTKHPRSDFIKVCVGTAVDKAELIALEELLQLRAGIRRTRECPQHRDWLNVLAHGSGASKGAPLATREQMSAGGKITGPINGKITGRRAVESGHLARLHELMRTDPIMKEKVVAGGKIGGRYMVESGQLALVRERVRTDPILKAKQVAGSKKGAPRCGRLYRTDPDFKARVDAADPHMWASAYPLLPPVQNYNGNVKGSAPRGEWTIVGAARPENMNPEALRGRRLRLAYACQSTSQFVAAYRADPTIQVAGSRANNCLGFMARAGFISLINPATSEVVLGPGAGELTWRNGKWMRGRVISRGPIMI